MPELGLTLTLGMGSLGLSELSCLTCEMGSLCGHVLLGPLLPPVRRVTLSSHPHLCPRP